jgi:ABC-type bacteriocin/lantibiotic exporter with double-glycine peptidase domain
VIKRKQILLLIVLLLLFPNSCLRRGEKPVSCPGEALTSRELDVKPIYQTALACGPASAAMVLNYHGIEVSLEKATGALYTDSLHGTLITDMRAYVSRFIRSVHVERSTICRVVSSINRGNPVILYLDYGKANISRPHYIVAVGYDLRKQVLVFHDGYSKFSKGLFSLIGEKWKKTGNLALYIHAR